MYELHVYRGRQGADVAMLLRRVRQRANRDLQVIGTSATLATQGLRAAVQITPPEPRLEAVAAHPLAAWLEERFGLDEADGRLVRRAPLTFVEGLRRLVEG